MSASSNSTQELFEAIYANDDERALYLIKNADSLGVNVNGWYANKSLLKTVFIMGKHDLLRELLKNENLEALPGLDTENDFIKADDPIATQIAYEAGIFYKEDETIENGVRTIDSFTADMTIKALIDNDSIKVLDYFLTLYPKSIHQYDRVDFISHAIGQGAPLNIIEILLKHGADPNSYNAPGYQLHLLSQAGDNFDLIKLLISYGSNPLNRKAGFSFPAEDMMFESEEIYEYLIDNYRLDVVGENGRMVLYVYEGFPSNRLLSKILSIYSLDVVQKLQNHEYTPLQSIFHPGGAPFEIEAVDAELLEYDERLMILFLHGADFNTIDSQGRTLLGIAEDINAEEDIFIRQREGLIELAKKYMNPTLKMITQKTIFLAGGNFSIQPTYLHPLGLELQIP